MKKYVAIALTGLSSILYLVLTIIDFKNGYLNYGNYGEQGNLWLNIGHLVYVIILLSAIAYAVVRKKYMLAVIMSALKITFPKGSIFLEAMVAGTKIDFTRICNIFYMIFAFIALISIGYFMCMLVHNNDFEISVKVEHFFRPLIVLLFLLVFDSYGNDVISSGVEMISVILLSVVAAELLFISVFVMVPFKMVAFLTSGTKVISNFVLMINILYWTIGISLLIFGIVSLIKHLISLKKPVSEELVH